MKEILSFSHTYSLHTLHDYYSLIYLCFYFFVLVLGQKTTFALAFTHILEYLQLQRYLTCRVSPNEKQNKNIYLTDKLPSVTFPPPHSTTTCRRSALLQQTSSQRLLPVLLLRLRSTFRGGHFHLVSRVGWCQMGLLLVATRWTSTRVASWATARVISVDHHHQLLLLLDLWMLFCNRKRLERGARSVPVVRQPALCCIAAGCSPGGKRGKDYGC